jgi:hypothetical protein
MSIKCLLVDVLGICVEAGRGPMVVDGEVTEVTVIAVLTHVFSRQSLTLAYAVGKPPMVVVTVQGAPQ